MTKEDIGKVVTAVVMLLSLVACYILTDYAPNIGWFMMGIFVSFFIDAAINIFYLLHKNTKKSHDFGSKH